MPVPTAVPPAARRGLYAALVAALVAIGAATAAPAPAAAAWTATTSGGAAEASLLAWTSRDRAALGLRPLRRDARLAAIAADRAANLAGSAVFSHQAAGGDLSGPLRAAGVRWYSAGEDIAWSTGGLTASTVARLYAAWQGSAEHWALLASGTFNYVGFGVVARPSDGRVFASAVFSESPDHTPPRAGSVRASRLETTITFTWQGADPSLQTHWAGMRDFDVWYRVDDGGWRLLRDDTAATSITLAARLPGHRYWLAVRPRDRAGNLGERSTPVSIWVP